MSSERSIPARVKKRIYVRNRTFRNETWLSSIFMRSFEKFSDLPLKAETRPPRERRPGFGSRSLEDRG